MQDLNRPWIFAGATSLVLQLVLTGLFFAFLAGCSSSQKAKEPAKAQELQEEVRLKSDRSSLDDLRSSVPDDVKQENDELAFVLGLVSEGKKQPSEIWSKFNDAVRKRREIFDKQERKTREEYTKVERKNRETFLAEQKKTRDEFFKKKRANDERNEFTSNQDAKRREFFDEERDKRKDFESEGREKRSDFEAYIREKRGTFDNEMKVYQKNFYDKKREEAAVQRAKSRKEQEAKRGGQGIGGAAEAFGVPASAQGPVDPDLEDFKNIPKGKATILQPTSEE